MTTFYVRSTDGNNADNGSTWALAKATIAGALASPTAGDSIYVSQVHAETAAGAINIIGGLTLPPIKITCGNDAAAPPTAFATSATVTTTGTGQITIRNNLAIAGITFSAGTGATQSNIEFNDNGASTYQFFDRCVFSLVNTNASSQIRPGADVKSITRLRNCDVKFGATGQGLTTYSGFHWCGGSVLSGSSAITAFLKAFPLSANAGGTCLVEDFDFSNCATGLNLTAPPPAQYRVIFRNCKLPASWNGSLLSTAYTNNDGGQAEMYNCDSGATNYRVWIDNSNGRIRDETTLVRTGGASDGVTPLSWKMATNAGGTTSYPALVLCSPEFVIYNSATGSSKTITVEILRDSATNLKDNEVWLEVNYLSATGSPLGAVVTDCVADPLTTAADQDASTATWTTTAMSNPNTQKLVVSFTPQMKGYLHCRVALVKATTTIYVDPKIAVT